MRETVVPQDGKAPSREDAQALAALVKAWDTARDAVRIAKGKPLPGSLRPKAKERKRNPNRAGQVNGHAEPQGPAIPEPLAELPKPTAQDNPSA